MANSSGIAMFSIGLLLMAADGKPIPGTPLRLNLRKECATRGVYDRASLSTSLQGSVCFSIYLTSILSRNHSYFVLCFAVNQMKQNKTKTKQIESNK